MYVNLPYDIYDNEEIFVALHEGRGPQYEAVEFIPNGSRLDVEYVLDGWAKIKGRSAFIKRDKLTILQPKECALVVASKYTVHDVAEYIRDNITDRRYLRVFTDKKGRYAISIGELTTENDDDVLEKWKFSGKIPNDSFCSYSRNLHQEINWKDAVMALDLPQPPKPKSKPSSPRGGDSDAALGLLFLLGAAAVLGSGGSSTSTSSSTQRSSSDTRGYEHSQCFTRCEQDFGTHLCNHLKNNNPLDVSYSRCAARTMPQRDICQSECYRKYSQ